MEQTLNFIKIILFSTASQTFAVFGILLLFGILLYILSRLTRNIFAKSIGYKFDIYITGWIGTPIHELGHALFCIPFGHKISEIKLFEYDKSTGTLGYVNHSYNSHNIWHRIGNFFIGIGPVLLGSAMLYLLIYFLLPNNEGLLSAIQNQSGDFSSFVSFKNSLISFWDNALNMIPLLFTADNLSSWQFWIFIYISLCISSHIELSPPDLKGVWSGLLSITLVLIIINIAFYVLNISPANFVNTASKITNITTGILMFATMLSLVLFIFSFIILNIFTLFRYQKLFHPFG